MIYEENLKTTLWLCEEIMSGPLDGVVSQFAGETVINCGENSAGLILATGGARWRWVRANYSREPQSI